MLKSFVAKNQRILRNLWLDLQYGSWLGGTVKTPYAHMGIQDTANTDYEVLPEIFANRIGLSDVLVDIGCGKGRVINWWLSQGFRNQIIGIEINQEIGSETHHRLQRHRNVRILCGDAIFHLPDSGTIFYLYNPFNGIWVSAFKEKMETLYLKKQITILYYNCLHASVFENDARWSVKIVHLCAPFHRLAVIKLRSS